MLAVVNAFHVFNYPCCEPKVEGYGNHIVCLSVCVIANFWKTINIGGSLLAVF